MALLFKSGGWELHSEGIERVKDIHWIEKNRIWETEDHSTGENMWALLTHLSEKSWMNPKEARDLALVFSVAVDYFKESAPTEMPHLHESIRYLIEESQRNTESIP